MNLKASLIPTRMSIEVLSSGLQTTIQDFGRIGWSHLGVPESGPADKYSFSLANRLLNKDISAAAIECTLSGPHLKFLKPMALAITGADMNPLINNQRIELNKVHAVNSEDTLVLSNCLIGCRSYIALSEDIIANKFLGSTSTYIPAKLGGINGSPLEKGLIIKTKENKNYKKDISYNYSEPVRHFSNEWELKVIKGPEFDFLDQKSQEIIFSKKFIVSSESNRMGSRLKGFELNLKKQRELVSCPVSIGTIQCPDGGLPIILGCDSQTLGGYPRILQVALTDMSSLGQLRPNDRITFSKLSIDQARKEFIKKLG